MSKHDKVRYYNFKDCIEANRTEICQICNKNKVIITDSKYELNRKGIWIYRFINYCPECWERKIEKAKILEVKEDQNKDKYYVLEMYPYPSGKFHMGHLEINQFEMHLQGLNESTVSTSYIQWATIHSDFVQKTPQ